MLLRHSLLYVLARGVPGLVNFAALAVYTRLLAPDEFGRYALALAGVGLVNVFIFQWQRLVLARFLQAHEPRPHLFLGGILAQFLALAAAVSGVGAICALIWPDPVWRRLLALAVPLVAVQAAFELTLGLAAASLQPGWYGRLLASKALIALTCGGALAWVGLGATAPLLGLIVGHLLALVMFGYMGWRGARLVWPDRRALREQLAYGLPLTVTFALAWVVSSSDRLLLAWLAGEDAAGLYSAGYDLAFQGLTLGLTIINTAAYPLAVNALERHGVAQAREQLRRNGELIIVAALTGATLLVVLAPVVVPWLIGQAFRADVLALLPWIAAATALAGIKAYHFDIAFHLGRRSRTLVRIGAATALVNVALNVWLIPAHGVLGAAWATLGAYAFALFFSIATCHRAFSMPAASPLFLKRLAVAAVAGLAAGRGLAMNGPSWMQLGAGVSFGVGGMFLAMLLCRDFRLWPSLRKLFFP
jgi:O-antigen/teichoic acid export membrane protein